MKNSFPAFNIVLAAISSIAAIISVYFSSMSSEQANMETQIIIAKNRAETCFKVADHYYARHDNSKGQSIAGAHSHKARDLSACMKKTDADSVFNCIKKTDDTYSTESYKDKEISC